MIKIGSWESRLAFGRQGRDWASKPGLGLKAGIGRLSIDLGFKAGIRASWLGFEQGVGKTFI